MTSRYAFTPIVHDAPGELLIDDAADHARSSGDGCDDLDAQIREPARVEVRLHRVRRTYEPHPADTLPHVLRAGEVHDVHDGQSRRPH